MEYRLDLAPVFQPDLLRNEKVIWVGQPRPGARLTGADLFLVPFSVMWGGFALVWEAGVLGAFGGHGAAPILFALWGVPFVVIGQYLIWGRFFYKAYRNRRKFYGITNQRLLVLNTGRWRQLQSLFLNQMPSVNKTVRRDGSGNLVFGTIPYAMAMYANTGFDFFAGLMGGVVPAFYDIPEVDAVYQLVARLKADLQQTA